MRRRQGDYPLLQRILALCRAALLPLARAIAAAAKRSRAATVLLLSAAGTAEAPLICGGRSGRCLFPGTTFVPAPLPPLAAVADAELLVLYAPDVHYYGAAAPPLGFAVAGFAMVLSS